MNLLVVAATPFEIAPLTDYIENNMPPDGVTVSILVTGVGIAATTYALTKHLQGQNYDLVLQAGVGGSFDRSIELGDLVFVVSEQYGDLGAEDHDQYLDIFDMGLIDKAMHPYTDGRLHTRLMAVHNKIALPHVSGITVNTVSGSEATIKRRRDKYLATVESMEGAALHYVCLREGVPFAQVRAISNYVTPRDKSQWRMKEAIINLNEWLLQFIDEVADSGIGN